MARDYRAAYNNYIFGDEILVSQNVGKHKHALNTLAFGTTGSGKSYGHVKPNLLQMNSAYVCTDPSGDISKELGEAMRRFGYRIKIFDINDKKDCDTYNPLLYCREEADVKIIVDSFIQSTDTSGKGSGSNDPFWDNAMNAFLCAMISLLSLKPEGSDVPYAQIPEIMGSLLYSPCFSNLTELTRIANKKWNPNCGIPLMPGASLGDGKNNTANASVVSAIYENIRIWEARRQNCSPEAIEQPYTLREWANFTLAPEKTSTTILMTTAVKLDSFNIQQIKDLTSSDTIDLYDFGNQRDILFLIIPNDVRTYDFLASFLYTQLFSILYHRGSYELIGSSNIYVGDELLRHFTPEQVKAGEDVLFLEKAKAAKPVLIQGNGVVKKKEKSGRKSKVVSFDDRYYELVAEDGTVITRRPTKALMDAFCSKLKNATISTKAKPPALPQPVKFICDEFANTGKIPAFLEKLATVRKYRIMITIICQNLSQLKKMYPDDWSTLDGNCPFFLFLGGDDNETTEYVSKKIGMETVRGLNNSVDNKKINASYQIDQRELMRPEDIGRIDFNEELLFIYGEQPIYAHKFDLVNHKNYKYTYDYANSLGFSNCCNLDRSGMGTNQRVSTIIKVETATAEPSVTDFSMDSFCSIMRKFSAQDAMNAEQSFYENDNIFDDMDDDVA